MSGNKGRMMIYPLTLCQRIKYFPFKFHWHHMPGFKETIYSFFILLPIMKKFYDLTYAPSNIQKYEEYLRKREAEREAHRYHLEKYYEDVHHKVF